MEIKKSVFRVILSLTLTVPVFAQSAASPTQSTDGGKPPGEVIDKKAVEKKALALIDEILKEAPALKLPENRIRLQANGANLLWKHNEKRARELFKLAMTALSDLNVDSAEAPGAGWNRAPEFQLLSQSREQLRQEILQMVAQHDPKLARELLRSSRDASASRSGGGEDRDLQTELGLAVGIAATDPAQALQIAKESLDKGLQDELTAIVEQLFAKDKSAANELVAAVMKKLRSANLMSDRTAASFAIAFLQMELDPDDDDSESKEKVTTASKRPQRLDERTLQELIDMVVTAALATPFPTSRSEDDDDDEMPFLLNELHSMMNHIERFAPGRVPALKKRFAEFTKRLSAEAKAELEHQALVEKGDVNSLVQAAATAPEDMREDIWAQVAMKALNEGDVERARQIVAEHFEPSPQRDVLLAQIDAQALRTAVDGGKLEEARHLLTRVSVAERVAILMQLAANANSKKDKKSALQFVEEARSMVGARASNAAELASLILIARTCALIDPPRAFDILEPVIDQLNTLLAAAAVLDGFEYLRYFKDGELLPHMGQSLLIAVVLQCQNEMGEFARADFDRARTSADRFQADDVRLMARLAVAQGILSDAPPRMNFVVSITSGDYLHRIVRH